MCSRHPGRLWALLGFVSTLLTSFTTSASVSQTEYQQLKILHTTPHPAPGWLEY